MRVSVGSAVTRFRGCVIAAFPLRGCVIAAFPRLRRCCVFAAAPLRRRLHFVQFPSVLCLSGWAGLVRARHFVSQARALCCIALGVELSAMPYEGAAVFVVSAAA